MELSLLVLLFLCTALVLATGIVVGKSPDRKNK